MGYWNRAARRAHTETLKFWGFQELRRLPLTAIPFAIAVLVIWWLSGAEQMNQQLRWAVALLGAAVFVYLPVFIINLLAAPGRMETESIEAHESEMFSLITERDDLSERLALAESASPRIVYDSNVVGFVFPNAADPQGKPIQLPQHYVGEIWFINDPMYLSERAVARSVHPTIEFWNSDRESIVFSMPGMWINAVGESLYGYSGLLPQIDIEPNRRAAKLMVALKYEADPECYGYNGEGVTNDKYLKRDQRKRLSPGSYQVHVVLNGNNVACDFWFLLGNGGEEHKIEFKHIQDTADAGA